MDEFTIYLLFISPIC